ncbi:MAG: type II toxin-antitoxin system RelE/ParE family toxin [Bryobacterales bacterium]|nr:type II toxin-antitoxin system RelE/ParE family toxin [Bryobacterales bacterium]
MAFQVRLSQPALVDLEEIFEYCVEHFPSLAESFATELLNHIETLGVFPHMGSPVRGRRGIRKIFHTPFTIYYRIEESSQTVSILHIWHGRRRKPEL